jgi:hypothetical protein
MIDARQAPPGLLEEMKAVNRCGPAPSTCLTEGTDQLAPEPSLSGPQQPPGRQLSLPKDEVQLAAVQQPIGTDQATGQEVGLVAPCFEESTNVAEPKRIATVHLPDDDLGSEVQSVCLKGISLDASGRAIALVELPNVGTAIAREGDSIVVHLGQQTRLLAVHRIASSSLELRDEETDQIIVVQ